MKIGVIYWRNRWLSGAPVSLIVRTAEATLPTSIRHHPYQTSEMIRASDSTLTFEIETSEVTGRNLSFVSYVAPA
jgi:hypothetical protein